ncbi:MAG: hypothetical protein U0894_02115 [Pirellulales bacterium]
MAVGFNLLGFKGGNGAMSDVIAKRLDRTLQDAFLLGPWGTPADNHFKHPANKKWAADSLGVW